MKTKLNRDKVSTVRTDIRQSIILAEIVSREAAKGRVVKASELMREAIELLPERYGVPDKEIDKKVADAISSK